MPPRSAAPALLCAAGCGLTPYAGKRDVRGVDMEGNTYAVQLAQTVVVAPEELDGIFDSLGTDVLFFHVAEQAATAFVLLAALSDGAGAQDPCAPVTEMNAGRWKTDTDFIVQGGHAVVPLGGKDVDLRNIVLEATVDPDTEAWSEATAAVTIDTEELRGGALPAGTNPCQVAQDACEQCDDGGGMTCARFELGLIVSLSDAVEFDPEPSGDGC